MQNKTASVLLIAGTFSVLISIVMLVVFYDPRNNLPVNLFTLDIAGTVSSAMAVLFFAFKYLRSGLSVMKLPGVLFIASSAFSLTFFVVDNGGSITYLLENFTLLTNALVWLLLCAVKLILGIQLIKVNKEANLLGWLFFLYGSLMILQLAPRIFYEITVFFVDVNEAYESKAKLEAFLFLVGFCTPVGFLLVAEKTEFLRNNKTAEPDQNLYFPEKEDSHDLLDYSEESRQAAAVTIRKDHNSVLWWMITFLLASVPVVGLGFCVYWSVSKSQVRRGNWAVTNVIVQMVSVLLFVLYNLEQTSQEMSSSELGLLFIGIVVFFAVIIGICTTYNNRNQENISLENYAYAPTVAGWIVYSLLMAIPLVNLICLIVYASDSKEKYRQTWAQARLLLIPFTIVSVMGYARLLQLLTYMSESF